MQTRFWKFIGTRRPRRTNAVRILTLLRGELTVPLHCIRLPFFGLGTDDDFLDYAISVRQVTRSCTNLWSLFHQVQECGFGDNFHLEEKPMNPISRTFVFGFLVLTFAVGGDPHLHEPGPINPQTPYGALSTINGTSTSTSSSR